MILFVVLSLMTVVALGLLVPPLLRRHGTAEPRSAYDLEIYRDQLRELERDAGRGIISPEEEASARLEIERRALAAAPAEGPAESRVATGNLGLISAFAVVIAIPLVGGSLYLGLGSPALEGASVAIRDRAAGSLDTEHSEGSDIAAMVERLAERLKSQPDDLPGWIMLGRSYAVLKRYDDAVMALRHAVARSGGDPDVVAMLAEHQVFAAGGMVTPESVKTFEAVLARQPNHPAARFYLALARAQAGDVRAAFDSWVALAKETPPDAPWLPALRAQIDAAAEGLGIEVPGAIPSARAPAPVASVAGPTREDMEAAAQMSAGDRMEMIRGMVARLAARLEANPDDRDGWKRLGRAYRVLGETARSRDALSRAAALDPDDATVLEDYGTAIVEATPDGAPVPQEAVVVFRRLAALDGDNRAALWHLGRAEAEGGNAADARALWRRLLDLLPPDSPRRAAVEKAIDGL